MQLKQVLTNLVLNAAAALEGIGRIEIGTRLQDLDEVWFQGCVDAPSLNSGEYVVIVVRDNGTGMDEETRRRAFEPYFTTKPDGHGLGLAAALGIVRNHRGAIRVESAPGEGTEFSIALPRTKRPMDMSAPPERGETGRRATILVVEDEDFVRSVVALTLRDGGHEVFEAANGQLALQALQKHPAIELVILDVMMPVLGGLDTLNRIRDTQPEMPVILMSGHFDTGSEISNRDPHTTFLAKPFDPEKLEATVAGVLPSTSKS